MKIFFHELRKITTLKYILIILAAFVVQWATSFIPYAYEHNYSPDVYQKYIDELQGEYTEAKRLSIEQRHDEINSLLAEHEEMESAYKNDTISLEEFEEHNLAYNKAKAEQSTIEYLLQKCDYFETLDGKAEFFFDTAWEDFLTHSGFNYIIAIMVFILIIPIFDNEYSCHTRSMLLTTKHGRKKLCLVKLAEAALVSFLISFLILMLKYFIFAHGNSVSAGNEIKNIMGFSGFGDITIFQYYLFDSLIKSAAWIVGGIFICFLSNFIRNTVFAYFFSAICMIVPALFSQFFTNNIFNYIFCSSQLQGMYSASLNLLLLFIIYICKIIVYSILNLRYWEKE